MIEYILKGESVEDKILHLASLGLRDDARQVMSTQLALKINDSPLTSVSIAQGAGVSIPVSAYIIPLSCRIEPIETEGEIAVLFEPKDELRTLCPELGLGGTVVYLKEGVNTEVTVYVTNLGTTKICLEPGFLLGKIEQVQAVYE